MATSLDIRAPEDQTEGTRSQVLRWLKAVGDTVMAHEPLIELETDKVTVEVPAPASGVLREIFKAEQDEIAPGDVLGRMEMADDSQHADFGSADAKPTQAGAARVERASSHEVAEARELAGVRRDATTAPTTAPTMRVEPLRAASRPPPSLSPAVRRLVTERGLDPSRMRGTGEGGRITVDDVLTQGSSSDASETPTARKNGDALDMALLSPAAQNPSPTQHLPEPSTPVGTRSRSIPHSAVRRRIADHMVQSLLQTAPHVTTVFEADLSAVIAHRSAHRAEFQQRGVALTFTAYFLAAIVSAIEAVPEANSRWTDTALEVYDDIHIGVATAVEGVGLVVPVVRNVQSLDLFAIASRLDQLVNAARSGRLEASDVRGGTFTISNHGVSGSLLATPIVINQPQSAILGVGKLEKRPVVVDAGEEEKLVVRPKCYVTLTIDHRVMDGHQANRFLQTFVRTLEAWPRDV